ncbi:MAG: response regulator transcription factor [Chitinophagaceae bacterium]|nr:response regulator transcription factor [Chitinophagaceae bacterium]
MQTNQIKVILVDDHQLVRQTWRMILEKDPSITVIAECSSGIEAIDLAAKLKPDVMLVDVNMSPVNGFETNRKITKLNLGVKIIGVSINNQPTYARNMMQLGAKGYVTKNSPKEEMIQAINEVNNGKTFICQEVKDKMTPNN